MGGSGRLPLSLGCLLLHVQGHTSLAEGGRHGTHTRPHRLALCPTAAGDDEWALRDESGFTWWADRQAQRVEVRESHGAGVDSDSSPHFLLSVRTEFLCQLELHFGLNKRTDDQELHHNSGLDSSGCARTPKCHKPTGANVESMSRDRITSAISPAVTAPSRRSRRPPPQTRKHPLMQVFSVMRAEGFEPSTLGLRVPCSAS